MSIKPIGSFVLIQPDESKRVDDNGMYIPDSSLEKSATGTVLEVSDGYQAKENGEVIKMMVSVGDRVAYQKVHGKKVDYTGDESCNFIIISQDDIYCKL